MKASLIGGYNNNLMAQSITSPAINQLDEQDARWFAVYTRYKREKWVSKLLAEKGIECYVPLQKVTRRYTRKTKHLELPLISCYIFVKITKPHYISVLETPDVVRFVKIARDLIAIPEVEMEVMKRLVGEGIPLESRPSQLVVGDRVRVGKGNLVGLEGVLVQQENGKQFLVELNQLGYQLLMSISESNLELVH